MALYFGPSVQLSLHWLGFMESPGTLPVPISWGSWLPWGCPTLQSKAPSTQRKMSLVSPPVCFSPVHLGSSCLCSVHSGVGFSTLCCELPRTVSADRGRAASLLSWWCSGELDSTPSWGLKHSWVWRGLWCSKMMCPGRALC